MSEAVSVFSAPDACVQYYMNMIALAFFVYFVSYLNNYFIIIIYFIFYLISFAIFMSEAASVFRAPEASTNASLLARPSNFLMKENISKKYNLKYKELH